MNLALSILGDRAFSRAVDVGAADGWCLQGLAREHKIASGLAIDSDPEMVAAGRSASADTPIAWAQPDDATVEAQRGTFDLVISLETIEHVTDASDFLDNVISMAAPRGTLLLSAPIEVGPSVLVKQAGRWFANRSENYSYERYSWQELGRAGVLWDLDHLKRGNLHSHKGFDYRVIAAMLREHLHVRRTAYSPVSLLGPVIASTVYWVAERGPDVG